MKKKWIVYGLLTVICLMWTVVLVSYLNKRSAPQTKKVEFEQIYEDELIAQQAAHHYWEKIAANTKDWHLGEPGNSVPVNAKIDGILTNNVIEDVFKMAQKTRGLTKTNTFFLTIIPSIREFTDPEEKVQSLRSLTNQQMIASIIMRDDPPVIFTDSLYFDEKFVHASLEAILPPQGFQRGGTNWWQLVSPLQRGVRGLNDQFTEFFALFPQELRDISKISTAPQAKDVEGATLAAQLVGYHIERNIYLIRILHTMHASSLTNGYVVIDSFHTNHFSKLCKQWNVDHTILN